MRIIKNKLFQQSNSSIKNGKWEHSVAHLRFENRIYTTTTKSYGISHVSE